MGPTLRNASNTPSNTHFSTHSLWLVKIHMRPTKFIWDPYDSEKYYVLGTIIKFQVMVLSWSFATKEWSSMDTSLQQQHPPIRGWEEKRLEE